jgi:hypothetical protein
LNVTHASILGDFRQWRVAKGFGEIGLTAQQLSFEAYLQGATEILILNANAQDIWLERSKGPDLHMALVVAQLPF